MTGKNETPIFCAAPATFREWLRKEHARAAEQWIGFYKVGSGRPSITWPEAVDEALCVGWIDGLRKRIDEASYKIRFTPRKRGSTWSAVNIARVSELTRAGRMQPAGLAAFEARTAAKSGIYAYEQGRDATLDAAGEAEFRMQPRARKFFEAQPAWYRRTATWWVISAKPPETRAKRLATLIADSEAGRSLKQLTRETKASTR